MKFVVNEKNGIFLATQDNLDEKILREQILNADACISDLDDTDAQSPAKDLAFGCLTDKDYLLDGNFCVWCLRSLGKLVIEGKRAESETWSDFVNKFLRDQKNVEKAKKRFNEEKVKKLVYPGVKELYSKLGKARKAYFSRNIKEVAKIFGDFLGFSDVESEVYDKDRATMRFVTENPWLKRYFIRGDSEEDAEILKVLKFFKKRGRIDYYVGCYVVKRPDDRHFNERFHLSSSRDATGLVRFLN
ncbi:MAG: hypothetical protein AABW58_03200 [Nanoarchaeota archaeon]